ncbi:hypothetical protein IE53DRAFT_92692 [Violaceomyces palustris]|uniref:Uncharacterized protein n=1 Tax=Violaceomyces palustris TaxID=1673888 RepID=A0ACD0NXL1_9BASI|nr:hypothetical protein IE53DRAFT_92692 [Violaceomyces palustris]
MSTAGRKLKAIYVNPPLSEACLARLADLAEVIHCYPGSDDPPKEIFQEVEAIFLRYRELPSYIQDLSRDAPNLKLIQLSSSGADKVIKSLYKRGGEDRTTTAEKVPLCNASGLHVVSIPPYIISTVLMVYHRLDEMLINARVKGAWIDKMPDSRGKPYAVKSIRGKTFGFLGYGHIARETARLVLPFGARVIAANTTGRRVKDTGYVTEGTGDVDCSIPEEMFSTSDEASLNEFLSRSDVLVASLPDTPATRWLMTRERLDRLPEGSVYVNVGRGTLCRSEDILYALEKQERPLTGAIMDVTDPEPLPDGHPLLRHPKAIVTPHLSGDAESELEVATDIFVKNLGRLIDGRPLMNVVDVSKGY